MIRYGTAVLLLILSFFNAKAMELPNIELPIMDHEQEISRAVLIPLIDGKAYVINDRSFAESFSFICKAAQNRWLMIDTPYTPLVAQTVMEWVSHKFGSEPQFTAINTHHHIDCVGGNKALLDNGFHVYATPLTQKCFRENNKNTDTLKSLFSKHSKALADQLDYTIADTNIEGINHPGDETTLRIGELDIKIMYPGHAHAQDNIIVYIPSYKILFGGCMIICPDRNLGYLKEANIDSWREAVGRVARFAQQNDVDYIIPGHNVDKRNDLGLFTLKNIEHTQKLTDNRDERERYAKEGPDAK